MADTHLRFTIGSVFSGEGFRQAQQAVTNVNRNVKQSNESLSQLAGALGQMDSSMARGAVAATNMLQALMTMNVTTIAVQGAMMAFNLVVQKVNERLEELTERANKARESVNRAFASKLSESVSSVRKEIAQISSEFESVTKAANAFSAAIAGLRSADAAGDVIALQTEKLNKMLEARSEAERQSIEQSYNLIAAQQKLANAEAESAVKLDAAHQAVVDSQNRTASIEQQIAVAAAKRDELESSMSVAKNGASEKWLEIQKKVNEIKEIEAELEKKRQASIEESERLAIVEQQVTQEGVNARQAANNEVMNVKLANQRTAEALAERESQERAAAAAAAEKASEIERERQLRVTASELQRQLNESQRALVTAQDDYAKALEDYQKNLTQSQLADYYSSIANNPNGNSLMPVDIRKGIALQTADRKVDEAIRNGAVVSVKDADRMRRQEARLARDEINKNSGQRSREAQKYNELLSRGEKAWSEYDRHFMQEYAKIQEAQAAQKKAVEDGQKAVEKQAEDVRRIKEQLAKLGLK